MELYFWLDLRQTSVVCVYVFYLLIGEAMGVSVEVLNDSARTVTPKLYVCEKQTFAAQSKRTVHAHNILFGRGDCVPAQTSQNQTKILNIPPQLHPTFFNCCMMKLEYRLKVHLVYINMLLVNANRMKSLSLSKATSDFY